jgi:hypothetical protein
MGNTEERKAYFPYLFTIQLAFVPYCPYLTTIDLAFLPYFPYHFTIQLIFHMDNMEEKKVEM